ncbi:MAG: class I tRNA ligase family protein [Kiritimatiellia bacterium]
MQGPAEGEWNPELLSSDDRHLLTRLHQTIRKVNEHLEAYRFNDYSHEVYSFIRNDYCDWYLEYAKEPLNSGDAARKAHTLSVMHHAFKTAITLLHPLMPFLTEELWEVMGYRGEGNFLMKSEWPKPFDKASREAWRLTEENMAFVDAKRDLIRVARQLRADYNIKPSQEIEFIVRPANAGMGEALAAEIDSLNRLVRGQVRLEADYKAEGAVPGLVSKAGNVYMPADDLIDVEAEMARLQKQLEELEGHINRSHLRLSNEAFIRKAPEEVVEQQRAQQQELIEKAEKIRGLLKSLAG